MSKIKQQAIRSFIILGIVARWVSPAWAMETTLRAHGGYNSNVQSRAHGPSSGFGQLDMRLAQDGDLFNTGAEYTAFADGAFTKALDPEYRLTAGGALETSLADDRLQAGATYAFGMLRGQNDVNTHGLTLWADWPIDTRSSLSLEQAFSREDYRDRVTLNPGGMPTYRLGNIHSPALQSWGSYAAVTSNLSSLYDWVNTTFLSGDPSWLDLQPVYPTQSVKRDDSFSSTMLRYTWAAHETVRLELSAGRDHLDSTVDAAIYRRTMLGIQVLWAISPVWEVNPQARWYTTHYKLGHPLDDDPDITKMLALGLTMRRERYALTWRVEWLDNDSPFEEECYTRKVAECILTYTF